MQNTNRLRVFIAGGTGLIGRGLRAAWLARGAEVVVGSRNPPPDEAAKGLRFVRWNSPLDSTVVDEIGACDIVYNLIGENIGAKRWSAAQRDELRRSRIESTEQILRALTPRTKVLLNASAVSAYPGDGKSYSESQPIPEPSRPTFIHQMTRQWEASASAAPNSVRTVLLRIGVVLGESGMLTGILPLFRWRIARYIGAPELPVPWVDIRDLTQMLVFLAEHESARGAFNLVGPNPTPFGDFSRQIQLELGIKSWIGLPHWLVEWILGKDASALVLAHYEVRPERILALGFKFNHTDLSECLHHALQAHKRSSAQKGA